MSSFPVAIEKLRTTLAGASGVDVSSARAVYRAVCAVSAAARACADPGELVASSALGTLEGLFSNRNVVISKALQTVINTVYVDILSATPGYAVRNVVTSLLAIFSHKSLPVSSKECALLVAGNVMEKRSFDLGNLMTDVVVGMTKLLKGSEVVMKTASVTALKNLCTGGGTLIADTHADMLRTVAKLVGDKSVEVRCGVALLVAAIASNSSGCTSVPADALLAVALKGMEDEVPVVQEDFAYAAACIYNEMIRAYTADQEKAKVGIARGGASDGDKTEGKDGGRRGSLLKLKELSAMKDMHAMLSAGLGKKASEELDFRSVVKSILKQTVRAPHGQHKAAFIIALQFLVEMSFFGLDDSDVQWTFSTIISSLAEPSIVAMSYEDIVYFRSRLSHLLRSIASQMVELNQLKLAGFMCSFLLDNATSRTEHEIQLAFGELSQLVAVLGEAGAACAEQIHAAAAAHLKHSSFGVRASAAHVLVGLATVVPALASGYFSSALRVAKEQVSLLMKQGSPHADSEADSKSHADVDAAAAADLSIDVAMSSGGGQESSDAGARAPPRKSPKDLERLRTMFNFHGQILLISTFLKQEKNISTGLPKELVLAAFDFGLDMLVLEIFSVDASVRHVVCSVIRAGSLIISSCLNMGYRVVNSRISKLLSSCSDILFATTNDQNGMVPSSEAPAGGQGSPVAGNAAGASPDLLYELMSVEAALVCISALLWFCPEALVLNEYYMELVVDGLDIAFHAIKAKYQAKFRSHFRFRTLHVILLECYSWLPHGSFPSTCQQLFVEGLRTFRDSIGHGYECTGLPNSMLPEHRILSVSTAMKTATFGGENPLTENLLMLRLEHFSVALQKKESEAFLASFTKDAVDFNRGPLYSNDWSEPLSPCAFIDSRTVDAALSLIGATFGSQSGEFQDKAIELCSQILLQVQKSASSVGIFTSDEEKKRRDRHALLSTKNTVTLLFNIVESFPSRDDMQHSAGSARGWVNGLSDKLFELLSYTTNADIRSVAANALCKLCVKPVGQHLIEAVAIRIIQSIKSCTDKKGEGADSACGYIIALSSLWVVACEKPTLQAAMSTIIFDTLKRYEYSPLFRGCTVFALSCIVRSKAVGQGSNDVHETIALISRVCDAAEGHLLYGAGNGSAEGLGLSGDMDLLLVCVQRLVNAAVSKMMEIDPTSPLMHRLFQLWETIRLSSSHVFVERECIEFIVGASMFPTEALPSRATAQYLQKVICRRSDINIETLQTAIAALRALVIRHSRIVCEIGIDIDLFKLLDWTVSSAYPLCTSPYWGVELRTGISGVVDSTLSLQRSVELCMDAIVGIDVQQRPAEAPVRWVLLCRSIALGATGVSPKQEDDSAQNVAGDEAQDDSDTGGAPPPPSHMTYQQFSTWKRDSGAAKASALTSARCRLRCVALHCCTAAFLGASRHRANADLQLCRAEIQASLDQLSAAPSDADLESVPCYLALFLQDIINMACACAAYTIDDSRQTSLQAESIDFLHVVVSTFWESLDPDVLKSSSQVGGGGVKILELSIAQIVSALRPCLSTRWCPALLWTTGGLICDLIRGGLLKDKTVIKRLMKTLISSCAIEKEPFTIRPPVSEEVAEEIGTISYVVNVTNLARIYLLGLESGTSRAVSREVKNVIRSSVSPLLPKLNMLWGALATDGARLLQGQKRWMKATAATDPKRGGVTYGTISEVSKIRSYYEYALPFVSAAVCVDEATDKAEDGQLSPFLFILGAILENLAALPHSQFEHKLFLRSSGTIAPTGGTVRLSRPFIEPLMYSGLACIARQRGTKNETRPDELNEWVRLVVFLCRDVIPHRSSSVVNSTEYISLCIEISNVLSALRPLTEARSEECDSSPETVLRMSDLWMWSWLSGLSLVSSFFPEIFGIAGKSSSFVSACREYASTADSDRDGLSLPTFIFPAVCACPLTELAEGLDERLSVGLSGGFLQNLFEVLFSLSMVHQCVETEDFMTRLVVAVLSRLSYHLESATVGALRKVLLGLLLKCWNSAGYPAGGPSSVGASHGALVAQRSAVVLRELSRWLSFYMGSTEETEGSDPRLPRNTHLKEVVETLFTVWITIFHEESDVVSILVLFLQNNSMSYLLIFYSYRI
jgi:hypothetical protein